MRRFSLVALLVAVLAPVSPSGPVEHATLKVTLGPGIRDAGLVLRRSKSPVTVTWRSGEDLRLVPGRYEIAALTLTLDPDAGKGGAVRIHGLTGEGQAAVAVVPGENALTLGGPFELRAEAVLWGPERDRLDVLDAHLAGAGGLRYRFELEGPLGSTRLRKWLRAGERTLDLDDLEYG